MRAREFINEISRRGFLKGAAAGAVVGAALSPFALKNPEVKKPEVIKKPENPSPLTNRALEKLLMKHAIDAGIKGVELAQLMAQCFIESDGYSKLREMGSVGRFRRLYDLMHNPANAKLLGNTKPGDGEKYHGRGFIQLTGKWNYENASKKFGVDLVKNPDLAMNPDIAAKIAIWYWNSRVRPKVSDFHNTAEVTRPINRTLQHLERREEKFKKYLGTMK